MTVAISNYPLICGPGITVLFPTEHQLNFALLRPCFILLPSGSGGRFHRTFVETRLPARCGLVSYIPKRTPPETLADNFMRSNWVKNKEVWI
jgi:hypothetical protein